MVKIYNMMLKPATPMTNEKYNYATDKINYSRNIKGIHFMFITLWPDSAERIWMEKDLAGVSAPQPLLLFFATTSLPAKPSILPTRCRLTI